MNRTMERRLEALEAQRRTRVAVVEQLHCDEPEEEAYARHDAAHPEDRNAELIVLLRSFSPLAS